MNADRRWFLQRLMATPSLHLGGMALGNLLLRDGWLNKAEGGAAADAVKNPVSGPHFPPRVRSVIWLFLRGGLSHLESFDPKPALNRYAGMSISETPYESVQNSEKLKRVRVVVVNDANGQQRNKLYPLQVGFRPRGKCGTLVSDWFPHLGGQADRFTVIRSMYTTDDNHGAQVQFHSGRHMLDPRVPTIGAWVHYGLGSLNENLPQFISMGPRFFDTRDGHYLGPAHDAVTLKVDPDNPLDYARPERAITSADQRRSFELAHQLSSLALEADPWDTALQARMESYRLAYRMQTAVPDIIRFDGETAATQQMYGLDQSVTRDFGQQLLAARRFVERGVRFVQIMHGGGAAGAWDQHSGLRAGHSKLAAQVDKPIAGLIQDLEQRGLLDETLIVLGTEFGRTPGSQGSDGRDHHPYGFSVVMAGGGIRAGHVHGSTDEIGFHAEENPHYVTDIHATLLHQMGLHPHRMQVPEHKKIEVDIGTVMHDIIA